MVDVANPLINFDDEYGNVLSNTLALALQFFSSTTLIVQVLVTEKVLTH